MRSIYCPRCLKTWEESRTIPVELSMCPRCGLKPNGKSEKGGMFYEVLQERSGIPKLYC